eukprot:scaffold145387_cov136-Phaeocystis_antarctica.AAC.2
MWLALCGRHPARDKLACGCCSPRPGHATSTSTVAGGVLSTTKRASATPVSPALLIATTTVRYVALCVRTPTSVAGSSTDSPSVAFTRTSNSVLPAAPSTRDTE